MLIIDAVKTIWFLLLTTIISRNCLTSLSYDNDKYLINTSGCKIPSLRLDHKDKLSNESCGKRLVLVHKKFDGTIRFRILTSFDNCCYRFIITYKTNSSIARYTECLPFKNGTRTELVYEFLYVQCTRKGKTYVDYYAFAKKVTDIKNNLQQSWNVIILGIDSMSRYRAFNSLKKTVGYMQRNQWLDYRGYNKIGHNTYPNLIAVLTGTSYEASLSKFSKNTTWSKFKCNPDMYKCSAHIIWRQFQKHGYITAFGEETVYMNSIFEGGGKSGFHTMPTHHYLRPFFIAGEKKKNSLVCTGEISSAEQILNYIEDFTNTYRDNKFFGFFWITSVSHDVDQSPRTIDNSLVSFFEKLRSQGVLENTFVFLFGDHGVRYGSVRYSLGGFYEDKSPMFFVWTPTIFKDTHPIKYSNLVKNQKRLVTPYDFHVTLQDILSISDRNFSETKAAGCPKCMSIFNEIPRKRTCSDAAIIEAFCLCHVLIPASETDSSARYSLRKSFEYVHSKSLTILTLPRTRCLEVSFQEVLRIHYYSSTDKRSKYYVAAFRTSPAGIVFQVIVRRFFTNSKYKFEIHFAETLSEIRGKGYCTLRNGDRYWCVCKKKEL